MWRHMRSSERVHVYVLFDVLWLARSWYHIDIGINVRYDDVSCGISLFISKDIAVESPRWIISATQWECTKVQYIMYDTYEK